MINIVIKYFLLTALSMFIILFSNCNLKPDLEAEKKKLLILHKDQQDAHMNKKAKQFVEQFADSMLSVNQGNISVTTKDSALKRFSNYFAIVEFKKWDDVYPPVIEFSEDGSMAYMIVDKQVILTYKNDENKEIEETTHFAWVFIFKKQPNEEWKIVCNVSTNEAKVLRDLQK
ncbi:MAG: hypothetical protein IPO86_09145 [Saprospiraceae bacterium]|nr:hypothetical protein [Saprospiraceae bacterium]